MSYTERYSRVRSSAMNLRIMVKIIVGENNDEDMKVVMMDPNTRSLLKVCINDIQNDAEIFQMLRGGTSQDLLGRKALVRSFRADRTLIDT